MYKEAFSRSKLFKFGAMALLLACCNLSEKPEDYALRKTFDSLYSAPKIADLNVVLEDLTKFGNEMSVLQDSETEASMHADWVYDAVKNDYTYYEFYLREDGGFFGAKFGFLETGDAAYFDRLDKVEYENIDLYKDFFLIPEVSRLQAEIVDPTIRLNNAEIQRIRGVSFKMYDNVLTRSFSDHFIVTSFSDGSKVEISRHEGKSGFGPRHYEVMYRINFYSDSNQVFYDADRIKIYNLDREIQFEMGTRYEDGSFYIQTDPEELFKSYLDVYRIE